MTATFSVQNSLGTVGTPAVGTLTLGPTPADGSTVTIGAKVYTFQAVLTNVDGNVAIGSSPVVAAANLANAINTVPGFGLPGVDFAAATTLNTDVAAVNSALGAVTATAVNTGVAGNAVATTSTVAGAAWSAATLLGGTNDANAYIPVAFFRQYHTDRGRDTTALTDAQVQIAIVQATDYIDTRWRIRFAGQWPLLEPDFTVDPPIIPYQSTLWPRRNIYNDDARTPILGLPVQLKKACAEYALRATVGPLVLDGPQAIVNGERQPTGEVRSTSVSIGGAITDAKSFETGLGGYGTGTILVDGIMFVTMPQADMLIEPLLDQTSQQRRASR